MMPSGFLKIRLKDDLELNPDSRAVPKRVRAKRPSPGSGIVVTIWFEPVR